MYLAIMIAAILGANYFAYRIGQEHTRKRLEYGLAMVLHKYGSDRVQNPDGTISMKLTLPPLEQ